MYLGVMQQNNNVNPTTIETNKNKTTLKSNKTAKNAE